MGNSEVLATPKLEITPEAIREQLDLIVQDQAFRTSKRSVQFLRYTVEQTLLGAAEQIKERTVGSEVFGRPPSYDTASDHVVRTAAIELRKRLAVYYNDERHRSELRIHFVQGSYVPHFLLPTVGSPSPAGMAPVRELEHEPVSVPITPVAPVPEPVRVRRITLAWSITSFLLMVAVAGLATWIYFWQKARDGEYLFWKPVLETPGPVLLAVGDILNGTPSSSSDGGSPGIPLIRHSLAANVPYADTVTIARVLSALQSRGKTVVMRPETNLTFSDFRDNPAVLIGAFNNEWSLRFTHPLRFSLALDTDRHLIYIRDSLNPSSRVWSQFISDSIEEEISHSGPILHDYALVSRVWNPETGKVVVAIGGLYAFGTEAAGEFVTDPKLMSAIAGQVPLGNPKSNLQIVLETTITEGTPGIPKVVATDFK